MIHKKDIIIDNDHLKYNYTKYRVEKYFKECEQITKIQCSSDIWDFVLNYEI